MQRRHLSPDAANRAIGMLEAGARQVDVAQMLNVSQSVVSRLSNRYQETGSVIERQGQGRPRATTIREDRLLIREARRNPRSHCTLLRQELLHATGTSVTPRTVLTRIKETELRCRRPLRTVPLTHEHKRARLAWCEERLNWQNEWSTVMFTDESRIGVYSDRRTVRVWRAPGRRVDDRYVQEVHPFKGGTIMVWEGIFLGGRTELYVCERNMTSQIYEADIIDDIVDNYRYNLEPHFRFLDDNATPHRARRVTQRLQTLGIERLPLPARSPDLNPIEHAWDMLGRAFIEHQPPPGHLRDMRPLLPILWDNLDQEMLDRLILSMPRRVQECAQNRGGVTHY
ncbi:hypothetical protein Zmor_005078 [Zophobas morio]|uniref:Paired domain-containing protein n=1 Tax=Zophobas morio TaxID=2755281 RepID=A0AA38MLN3_9CUCU|nr:hypothetical protein Zmor_005078 [Zophobas morio]